MKFCLLVFYFVCFQRDVILAENCARPDALRAKEEYCWKDEVEIVDRIQQTSKSVLNFAKKKLGIEVEETNEPQKCEYYQCIFIQLKLFNNNGFPIYENFEKWIESEVVYEQATRLLDQLNKCNEALGDSTVEETYFYGDLRNTTEKSDSDKPQTPCERAAEFMKCLSYQENCPVFKYP